MIAKRHQVDAGDATVSDLQIYYLQHDPASWIIKSTGVSNDANSAVRKALRTIPMPSAASATTFSTIITTVGTLVAILLGVCIAFFTAKTIQRAHPSAD